MRNKKALVALLFAIVVMGIIAGTYAYFESSVTISNDFSAKSYSTTVQRDLTDGNWLPGTTIDVTQFSVKNTGQTRMAVRAWIEETIDREGVNLDLVLDDGAAVVFKDIDSTNWIYDSGYYYYKSILDSEEETTDFIRTLTFNSDASNNPVCVEEEDTITCSGDGTGYDNSVYTITVHFDTIQETGYEASWNVNLEELAETTRRVVIFNPNGGTVGTDSMNVTAGSTYGKLPTPERAGYNFDGWYTALTGGDRVTRSSTVSFDDTQTLYAHWNAKGYTVSFDAKSGSSSSNSINVTFGEKYGTLPVATLDGYNFIGWFTDENDGIQVTSTSDVDRAENHTLYAHYVVRTDVPYVVKHWLQKLNGVSFNHDEENYKLEDTQNFSGTTNDSISPSVKSFDGFTAPAVQDTTIAADGSTVVNYYYTRNKYSLEITADDGVTNIQGAGEHYFEEVVTVTYSISSGYEFSAITGDKTSTTFEMPAEDISINIGTSPKTFSLTFNANGGNVSPSSGSATYASTYGSLPTPTRTGYDFGGWYTAATGGDKIEGDTTVSITGPQTLYAHWNAKRYTVTFDANGGEVGTENKDVYYDDTYGALPTPEKEGYGFAGWFTAANDGDEVNASTIVKLNGDQTLYAHWSANTYLVTYDANGGAVNPTTKNVTVGSTYGTLAVPSRVGYKFDGWFTEAEGGSEVTSDTSVPVGEHFLYAHWTKKSYVVSFDANGGNAVSDTNNVKYGEVYGELPTPTRTGYTFAGWYTEATDGTLVTSTTLGRDNESDETLYAHWSVNTYTLTVNGNGGIIDSLSGWTLGSENETSSKSIVFGTNYGSFPNVSRTGYTFDGWYDSIDNDGNLVQTNDTYSVGDHQTLWAKWTPVKPTVTFDGNGGTFSETEQQVTYGLAYGNLPTVTTSPTGYTFAGWYTARNGGDLVVSTTLVDFTANKTLYAHWTANNYVLTADGNGGIISPAENWTLGAGNTTATKSVAYNANYGNLPSAELEGYDSKNWWTLDNGGSSVNSDTVMSTEGATIYHHWDAKKSVVSFDANGGTAVSTTLNVSYNGSYGDTLPGTNRDGYTFAGWFTEAEGGSQIKPKDTVKIVSNQTLYAHWNINQYNLTLTIASNSGIESISYSTNGGTSYTTVTETAVVPLDFGTNIRYYATASSGYEYTEYDSATNYGTAVMGVSGVSFSPVGTATANSNIIAAYTYNENSCVTGSESGCVAATCITNGTTCDAGTIIDYKVNNTETVRFHVLHDNGTTMTLQAQRNTVYNTAWYSGGNNHKEGPQTIMAELNRETNGWSNVKDITLADGMTQFNDGTSANNNCTETSCSPANSSYGYPYSKLVNNASIGSTVKARMITITETAALGCTTSNKSCPIYLYNYLYDSASYCRVSGKCTNDQKDSKNYGYWTLGAYSSNTNGAWYVGYHGSGFNGLTTSTSFGARAVVVIDK